MEEEGEGGGLRIIEYIYVFNSATYFFALHNRKKSKERLATYVYILYQIQRKFKL